MGLFGFFFSAGGDDSNGEQKDKYAKAQKDETSLGNVLLDLGYVSEETLEVAIKIQKSQSMLGRILVNMDEITEEQLKDALLEQKILRKTARAQEVIKSNTRRHSRLVEEVQSRLMSLDQKYTSACEK